MRTVGWQPEMPMWCLRPIFHVGLRVNLRRRQQILQQPCMQNSQVPPPEIQSFYSEYGIKQKSSFSGGFKYLDKPGQQPQPQQPPQGAPDLYREFGLARTPYESYKLDREHVPDTKQELADRLVEKLEHKMNKMNYYRNKYYGDPRK